MLSTYVTQTHLNQDSRHASVEATPFIQNSAFPKCTNSAVHLETQPNSFWLQKEVCNFCSRRCLIRWITRQRLLWFNQSNGRTQHWFTHSFALHKSIHEANNYSPPIKNDVKNTSHATITHKKKIRVILFPFSHYNNNSNDEHSL